MAAEGDITGQMMSNCLVEFDIFYMMRDNTIRGVQRLLKEHGNKYVISFGKGQAPAPLENQPADTDRAGEGVFDSTVESSVAKTVAEIASEEKGRSRSGLLSRLRGGDSSPEKQNAIALNADDRRLLQATLFELLECKRLLDQVR